jgi:hypothetical protein
MKGGPDYARKMEVAQGKNIVEAVAAEPALQHFVWSTLPNSSALSGGKFVVPHMQAKIDIDKPIFANPALLAKTTFFWVGYYGSNLTFPMIKPIHVPTADTWIQLNDCSPETPIYTVGDARKNIGPLVIAVLDQPDLTLNGATVFACSEVFTAEAFLALWGKMGGRKTKFVRIDSETYYSLWPNWAKEFSIQMGLWDMKREKSWTRDEGRTVVLLPADLNVELEKNTAAVMKKQFEDGLF